MNATDLPKRFVLGAIRLYQLTLSPYLGRQCRFYPTCSHYARQAVDEHGLLRGGWFSLRRLCRCHPFNAGGVDLVPAGGATATRPDEAGAHIRGRARAAVRDRRDKES